jgi:hypothetical protein
MRARVGYDEEMGGISVTLIGRDRQSRRRNPDISWYNRNIRKF